MTIDEISEILSSNPENFPQALVQYLEKGGDINARGPSGRPLVVQAAEFRNLEALKCLLENSANINNTIQARNGEHHGTDGGSVLHVLADTDNARTVEIVDFLLDNNVDVNIKTAEGDTPLHTAMRRYNYQLVEKLIKKHADINLRDSYGNTAIVDAAANGSDRMVRLLAKTGADVEAFLKYPAQFNSLRTMRYEIKKRLKAYRPKMYEILKEYNRLIPTPSTSYKTAIAQEVALHNAEVEKRRIITDQALTKAGLYKDVKKIVLSYLYDDSLSQVRKENVQENAQEKEQEKAPPPSQLTLLEPVNSTPEVIMPKSTEAPIAPTPDKASESILNKLKDYIAKLSHPHEGTYGRSDQIKKIKVAEDIQRMLSRPIKPEDFSENIKHIYFQIQKNRIYTGSRVLHGYGQLDKILKEAKERILNSVRQEPYGNFIAELADYIQNAQINGVEKRSTLLGLRSDQVEKLEAARQVFELIKPGTHTNSISLEAKLIDAIKLNSQATVKTPFQGSGKLDNIFQELLKEVKKLNKSSDLRRR